MLYRHQLEKMKPIMSLRLNHGRESRDAIVLSDEF